VSSFPRIDPEHPLAVAARDTNAMAEERGLEQTVDWLGMDVGVGELAYLAEQRSLRAVAAATLGMNTGAGPPALDAAIVGAIVETPMWQDFRPLLLSLWMDGTAIGWRARQVQEDNDASS